MNKCYMNIAPPQTSSAIPAEKKEARQLHAQFVVSGLVNHPMCPRRLLQFYAANSETNYALSIFNRIPSPDVFTCNTMMRGLILGKCPYDALLLYQQVLIRGLEPDNHTYTFALKACSHLKSLVEGKQVHCRIIKLGIAPDTHVHSSLIHMYTSSGSSDDAAGVLGEFMEENTVAINSMISGYLSNGEVDKGRAMFDKMTAKDVASWSAMISGYTKNGMHAEALALFQDMMALKTLPNESILVSLLSACAHLGALHQGRWIHAYIDKVGAMISTKLSTALIDMYVKCGDIQCGYEFFRKTSHKDVVTWGAIISGFAIYGQARKCFELFEEMLGEGKYPNEVVFVAILSACSHAGYVEEGKHYFNQMIEDFGIRPSIEHYGCMVDLLGRAGRLKEAEELIISMPEQPNSIIWGAMLSGCRTHNDLKRGKWAFEQLIKLEPMSGDRYKLAGLMYAKAGEKEEADKIRKMMKDREMETTSGSSFIEVNGMVHEFVVGQIIHTQATDIYGIWKGVETA
ncbi:pentatricopeptide repeat-containing protein At5g66520 [Euphorbia lathyris]|uniref:pentatricopeptide repeat-containing protein At5g66520 n=1 Tax=Euphorbia lathyris TaxID=212925 RepID=UPI00331427ED